VELTRVFRQTESDFVDALSRIRSNTNVRPALDWINAGCVNANKPAGVLEICLVPTRARAEAINRDELCRLHLPERRYSARIEGRMPMDRKMPSPNDLDLRIGAQVMFTKNDKERRWVNGTMGRVVSICESTVDVKIDATAPGLWAPWKWESLLEDGADSHSSTDLSIGYGCRDAGPDRGGRAGRFGVSLYSSPNALGFPTIVSIGARSRV
jgi:hypothetical protein